jgi:hypothetical protein
MEGRMIAQLVMYEYKSVNNHFLHGIYENDITWDPAWRWIRNARARCVSSSSIDY